MATASDQPNSASITRPSANRFTPAISTDDRANVTALTRCVVWLNRFCRNSGTLRALLP